jgi:hypothetical protein
MAIFLLTTEPTQCSKNMLMKRTTIFLCALLFLLTRTFSQEDTVQVLKKFLPLQVMNIDAKVIDKNVQLLWTVSRNEEARGFEVERAEQDGEYKKIGGKLPITNTDSASYEFVDAMPKKNVGFTYRVKVLAKDGTSSYSDYRSAKVYDEIIRCKLKQNPVRHSIDAEVISTEAGNIQVSIFTNYGQKVLAETAKLSIGINQLSFSSQNLQPGLHRLVLESGNERKVISFVKE